MPIDVVSTVRDLIRIPSVNPMGREVQGDEFFEHRMTDHLQALFEQIGLPWQRQTLAPRQDNIVARLDGDIDAGLLLFEAHQDTVPVDGMTIDPWDPQVRDGRVYGRGSCDIKGGMACMLTALVRLAEEKPPGMPTLVMACSANEEFGTAGAGLIPKLWQGPDAFLPRRPDAAIVAEPTMLNVVVAHKGTVRWHCHTSGVAAHSSAPEKGDNAVYRMAEVLQVLDDYARNELPQYGSHRLLGSPTLSVGLISGGISVNTVPDRCTIEIDRRLLPGDDAEAAWRHAADFVQGRLGADFPVQHDRPYQASTGLSDTGNSALAEELLATIRDCGHDCQSIGVPFGTDAPAFAAAGVPTVVFGPGDIQQAHTVDEWIAIDQLHWATEVLYRFARSFSDKQ